MTINRYATRSDSNRQAIVDALRDAGCVVYDIKRPVDLMVGAPGMPSTTGGCIGRNPTCPCADGMLCHYKDSADGKTKGWPIPGWTLLMEIKRPTGPRGGTSGRKHTKSQASFLSIWNGGPVATVTDVESALRAIGVVRGPSQTSS